MLVSLLSLVCARVVQLCALGTSDLDSPECVPCTSTRLVELTWAGAVVVAVAGTAGLTFVVLYILRKRGVCVPRNQSGAGMYL